MKVFFHTQPTAAAAGWRSLSECVGITSELADVASQGLPTAVAREIETGKSPAILLDVASLKDHITPEQLTELAGGLAQSNLSVLLLVGGCGEPEGRFVKALTRDGVTRVSSAGCADSVGFPAAAREFSQELAGHSFARESGEALGLEIGTSGKSEVIMSLGQSPAFVCVPVGRAKIFVWATDAVFDVTRPLKEEREFELAADKYIPAIVFLRNVFGDRCWRNPVIGAGLVIDDPLLEKEYGFIHFPRLLESARRHAYHVTLAFIPWNHWRGSAAKARMFLDHADCFSLCVHGCDHTNKEYESTDYEDLLARNFTATRRMNRHRERTGMTCEPLMVCPQELYSPEAMRAFADSRQFSGLVCTACMPRNLPFPQLYGADLLLPAQDSFFGVPVFKRHYWSDIAVFAMAVFLGKPAILVEHHEFFRNGPGGAEKFVTELAQVRPDVRWSSLGETVRRTHLRRRLAEHRHEVRFFADDFEMEAERDGTAEYNFFRRIPATTSVRRVTVNGVTTPFAHQDGRLSFTATASAAQAMRVRVEVDPVQPKLNGARGIKYHAVLALRRGLSELRDKVIARNDFALRTARKLASILKQTGNS